LHARKSPDRLTVREFLAAGVGLMTWSSNFACAQTGAQPGDDCLSSTATDDSARLQLGGSTIEIMFRSGTFDLPCRSIIAWISKAARAVAHYYGVFPVPFMRVRVNSAENRSGTFGGVTFGSNPPFTRIFVGRHTTIQQLDSDWLMTHELVHTAFPDVADEHHWIEEGIATYVEPIARVQAGDLTPERIWADMALGMPKGEPQPFDQGLDYTHTWGRTYWGGALFCLVADVRIRQTTNNQRGLQDALRGVRNAGGTIDNHWPVDRAFAMGDKATRTKVLTTLYKEMKDKPVYIDLNALWRELGVNLSDNRVSLSDKAPLARIRQSIESGKSL
jgi:hypothetical protein